MMNSETESDNCGLVVIRQTGKGQQNYGRIISLLDTYNIIKHMVNNLSSRISFPDDIDVVDTISEILASNGVAESVMDSFDKTEKGEKSSIITLLELAKETILQNLPLADLTKKIEGTLNFPPAVSEKVANSLKEKIISKAKKIRTTESLASPKTLTPTEGALVKPLTEINKVGRKPVENPFPKRSKKVIVTEEKMTKPSPNTKSDTYREPIE